MSKIEDRPCLDDECESEPDQNLSWLEEIPITKRIWAFSWRATIGVTLAGSLWFSQYNTIQYNTIDIDHGWIGLIPFSLGLIFGWRAYRKTGTRKFKTHVIEYSLKERLERSGKYFAVFLLMLFFMYGIQFLQGNFNVYWWYAWPLLIVLCPAIYYLLLVRKAAPTPEAEKLIKYYRDLDIQEIASRYIDTDTKKVDSYYNAPNSEKHSSSYTDEFNHPIFRYLAAAALIYAAYYFAFESEPEYSEIWAIICALGAAIFARELSMSVLGIGLVAAVIWLIYAGISALPVSVAIIIGALIIASALRS